MRPAELRRGALNHHIPIMTWLSTPWTSAPDTAGSGSASDSQYQLLEQSCTWRGKRRAWKSWKRGCAKDTWIERLSGRISAPSTGDPGLESWISSLRESRASRGAKQGSERDSATSGTSERSLFESLTRWDRASSSWRTCGGLFDSEPPIFSGDWPTSGSMRSGACFRARASEPLISASGSSFWRTPATVELDVPEELLHSKDGGPPKPGERVYRTKDGKTVNSTVTLGMQAEKMWPTPMAGDSSFNEGPETWEKRRAKKEAEGVNLHLSLQVASKQWHLTGGLIGRDAASQLSPRHVHRDQGPTGPGSTHDSTRLWPTPNAMDDNRDRASYAQKKRHAERPNSSRDLPVDAGLHNNPQGENRRLNPTFVEWLMGLPEGWTDSECSATAWTRWWALMRSLLLRGERG